MQANLLNYENCLTWWIKNHLRKLVLRESVRKINIDF